MGSLFQKMKKRNTGSVVGEYYIDGKDIKKPLGEGSFGTVYLAAKGITDGTGPKDYVVKKIPRNSQFEIGEKESIISKELIGVEHPNLLSIYAVESDKEFFYIVTKFCNTGTLEDYCRTRYFLTELEVQSLMAGVAQGLVVLHSKKVAHRDFKLENIYLHTIDKERPGDIIAVIGDYGFSKSLAADSIAATSLGTPLYMAPEIYNGELYTTSVDIWAFGISIYKLCFGEHPFGQEDVKRKIELYKYKIPQNFFISLELLILIESCLQNNPKKRYSGKELAQCDFFTKPYEAFQMVWTKKAIPMSIMEKSIATRYKEALPEVDKFQSHFFLSLIHI
eukprot:TRINITY_DN1400_c0_g1_i1.p1 TRINITY_DN1400_c0_g1~~TRINITY_DN1400_c0_g1_i1.p1  ORF type:complete len:376 (+),score=59.59 TRINITY_DN1400_c0_g1_i1:124-1128(+)